MRCSVLLLLLLAAGCRPGERVDFNREVRPILNEKCVSCHGGVRARGELRLTFLEDALRGGESGQPAVVPGDPGSSRLITLIDHPDSGERMPKDGDPLSAEEVRKLRRWIAQGAEWEPHWAYRTPDLPLVPEVGKDWARSPLDRFVYRRLAAEGLDPSPDAPCRVLGRRLTLDLTGLPANPDRLDALCEVESVSDASIAEYVDELLANPGFGERWAAMWLDLARYADSKGYEADRHRTIWAFRDWVIRAFERDMPFDLFTIEQLAGDLLPEPDRDELIATAFHRNAMTNEEGGTDDEEHRIAAVVDRVNTTWEVWQGTTMACAQCHGHPYDPFRHEDYYRSLAVFNNTADWDQPDEEPILREYSDPMAGSQVEARLAAVDRELEAFLAQPAAQEAQADWESKLGNPMVVGKLTTTVQNEVLRIAAIPATERTPHQRAFIRDRFAEVHESTADFRTRRSELLRQRDDLVQVGTPIMQELAPIEARVTRLMERGNFLTQAQPVEPGIPQSIPGRLETPDRLGFARWLVSPENPLTARATVNRFWEQLFGTGIVLTLEDFGTVGEPPTHPDLLDWLAVTFRTEMGWSVKALLREIVLSSTYRQSSVRSHNGDPDNRLLSRGPRVRLSGEQLRDQALAVGGLLSDKRFGPSVMPYQPEGIWRNPYNGSRWVPSEGEDRYRRALYTYWRRTAPYPSMMTFDAPSREVCVSRRVRTNTPLQALVTLNDPVFWEASVALSERMEASASDVRDQLAHGYRWALGRFPSVETLDTLEAVAAEPGGLQMAASVILNLDEFLTKG